MNDVFLQLIKLKPKGYCCAQLIVMLALKAQGKTNDDLVRSVGGLCFGNWSGEFCGALSGGACVISLYSGKGGEEEAPDERHMTMMGELAGWFREVASREYGGTRCDEILEKYPSHGKCGQIVAETYDKCMEILVSHGFDPAVGSKG
ncbi:hypothetical protein GEOBRER4_n1706 [Citrifermentans bremense]|uniref:C_GCAxxG_C_C family protein n=1 Tax=Citrifermentans bremense TaxID=60035 RepID=A0A6S6M5I2_9BACT|nr:DV_1555 family C-GCAxxG-C-C protein [Citrifermentans bremense]BCG46891.1 hypothetical protein GEOBRER4_n1706 [Citrifermentans bremense]